jgi:hypothetical protein
MRFPEGLVGWVSILTPAVRFVSRLVVGFVEKFLSNIQGVFKAP